MRQKHSKVGNSTILTFLRSHILIKRFSDDGTPWKGQLQFSHHLHGVFAEDTLWFHTGNDGKQRKQHFVLFKARDTPFVRGLSMDPRLVFRG